MSITDLLAEGQLTGGRLNGVLATAIVRVHTQSVGRGPTKAQVIHRNNVVVALLQDARTKGEQTLMEAGDGAAAIRMRQDLQHAMRNGLVAAVEELTGCRVVAFMSDNHVEPDLVAQIFVLDRPLPGEQALTPSEPGLATDLSDAPDGQGRNPGAPQ
jgi:uncharacterized protein YbcI